MLLYKDVVTIPTYTLPCLKILSYCELKLVDEYLLEGIEILDLIKDNPEVTATEGR